MEVRHTLKGPSFRADDVSIYLRNAYFDLSVLVLCLQQPGWAQTPQTRILRVTLHLNYYRVVLHPYQCLALFEGGPIDVSACYLIVDLAPNRAFPVHFHDGRKFALLLDFEKGRFL